MHRNIQPLSFSAGLSVGCAQSSQIRGGLKRWPDNLVRGHMVFLGLLWPLSVTPAPRFHLKEKKEETSDAHEINSFTFSESLNTNTHTHTKEAHSWRNVQVGGAPNFYTHEENINTFYRSRKTIHFEYSHYIHIGFYIKLRAIKSFLNSSVFVKCAKKKRRRPKKKKRREQKNAYIPQGYQSKGVWFCVFLFAWGRWTTAGRWSDLRWPITGASHVLSGLLNPIKPSLCQNTTQTFTNRHETAIKLTQTIIEPSTGVYHLLAKRIRCYKSIYFMIICLLATWITKVL